MTMSNPKTEIFIHLLSFQAFHSVLHKEAAVHKATTPTHLYRFDPKHLQLLKLQHNRKLIKSFKKKIQIALQIDLLCPA
jgi:hypothetical protein